MNAPLLERYRDRIAGVLTCHDRVVVTGTLPGACHAAGMTSFLNANPIRIFDYARFAEPLRERRRANAEELAASVGVRIQYIAKAHIRKESIVAEIIKARGDHPGLVHIILVMEACSSYKSWHDKRTHQTFLRPTPGKCLHYYFYFINPKLGLIYLRVPTWCPFRLQFYCNGHSWLARQLMAAGIDYTRADNTFIRIDDWTRAQHLADSLSPDVLHRLLDRYTGQCCPILDVFNQTYHWGLMQVECSTDLAFRSDAIMKHFYAAISREAIVSVKAPQVMHFLDKLTSPKEIDGHHVKGFNFFDKTEHDLLCALHHPEFNIRGVDALT